jgi:hypothetical protein
MFESTLIVAGISFFTMFPIDRAFAQETNANSASHAETVTMGRVVENGCVAELPFARGAVFCSLDEYLAHLETLSAIDLPWWREISPGVYEHVVRMTGAEREVATREQLMHRFQFRR